MSTVCKVPVTVVIPAHNRAELLPRALASVTAQREFRPADVIVVDDASEDDTAAVARAHGVRVVRHAVNLGPSAARNTGFAAATTPWLVQLDSDDEWLPHCLSTLWLLRHGHVLVTGASVGGPERPWYNGVPAPGPRLVTARELVFPDNFIASSAVLLDAECVRRAGGYRTDLRYAEDLELWLRMLELGTAVATPVVVTRYHGHSGQATAIGGEAHAGHRRVLELSVDRSWWRPSLPIRWSAIPAWDELRVAVRRRGAAAGAWNLVRHPQRLRGLATVLLYRYATAGRWPTSWPDQSPRPGTRAAGPVDGPISRWKRTTTGERPFQSAARRRLRRRADPAAYARRHGDVIGSPRNAPGGLMVCPRYPYPPIAGGVKRTLRLAECMQRAGLEVTLITDDRPDPAAVAALEGRGWGTRASVPTGSATARRLQQHALRLPGPRAAAIAGALASDPAGSWSFAQLEGVIATSHLTRRRRLPIIFSTHNVEAQVARAAIAPGRRLDVQRLRLHYHTHRVARAEAAAAAAAAAVICVSDADAECFAARARRVIVAPNGVDDEFFAIGSADQAHEDILFFGQFTYEPNRAGIERFLKEGWPVLEQRRPHARLLLAGEGSEDVLGAGGRSDRIIALGLVPDIAETVARVRLTIVPIWQGGGTRLKVLESLAAMRPVVGTPLGVSGVGFAPNRHGLVGDTAAELAAAAAALLERPERLAAMGDDGRRLARAYAWRQALAPVEDLYRAYADGARP